MSLAERLLDRQRALVIDNPTRGMAVLVGGVGILPGERLELRLTAETFQLACEGRVLVSPKETSPESMALLASAGSVTVLQQGEEGDPAEFPGVPVVKAAA